MMIFSNLMVLSKYKSTNFKKTDTKGYATSSIDFKETNMKRHEKKHNNFNKLLKN